MGGVFRPVVAYFYHWNHILAMPKSAFVVFFYMKPNSGVSAAKCFTIFNKWKKSDKVNNWKYTLRGSRTLINTKWPTDGSDHSRIHNSLM